ncbi:MAG TPA: hypothetical protein VGP26_08805 [Actinophytocola sp.]|jgi:ribosomal protein L7/L12|nr:hypothetical protein [Actinophytocola sp.]
MPVALQVVFGVAIALMIALLLFRRPGPHPVRPPSADLVERLRALVAEGRRIQAIKELREQTRMSLLDAKNYVDRLGDG